MLLNITKKKATGTSKTATKAPKKTTKSQTSVTTPAKNTAKSQASVTTPQKTTTPHKDTGKVIEPTRLKTVDWKVVQQIKGKSPHSGLTMYQNMIIDIFTGLMMFIYPCEVEDILWYHKGIGQEDGEVLWTARVAVAREHRSDWYLKHWEVEHKARCNGDVDVIYQLANVMKKEARRLLKKWDVE